MSGDKSPDKGMGSRPGRREAARVRMLQAGLDAWLDDPPATPFENIQVRDVVAAAGRTTGAFYNLWPAIEEYRADLLEWTLDPHRPRPGRVGADLAIREVARQIEVSTDPLPLIRAIAQAVVESNVNHEQSRGVVLVQYSALASAQAPGEVGERARRALQAHYTYLADFYDPAYAEILRAWQRRVRPPWQIRSASMAMTALVDGYVMRSLFDAPTIVGPDVFSDALIGLITAVTTSLPMESRVDPDFDLWAGAELGAPAGVHPDLDDRIARATAELYVKLGTFEAVTPAAIAETAGVSQRAVRESVNGRGWRRATPIWRLVLLPQIEEQAAKVRDVVSEDDPIGRLTGIAHVVALVAARDRELTNAFLHVLHGDVQETSESDRAARSQLFGVAEPDLRAAYYAGLFDRSEVSTISEAMELAEVIVVNVLWRLVRSRAKPVAVADQTLRRLLSSLLVSL